MPERRFEILSSGVSLWRTAESIRGISRKPKSYRKKRPSSWHFINAYGNSVHTNAWKMDSLPTAAKNRPHTFSAGKMVSKNYSNILVLGHMK